MLLSLSLFRLTACLLFLVGLGREAFAQAIASFYTGRGPGLITQDVSTGRLLVNVYTATGYGYMQNITIDTTPKNGTALAATAWNTTGGQSLFVRLF